MKKILNIIMALLTGAVSMSALGLCIYGVEAAFSFAIRRDKK